MQESVLPWVCEQVSMDLDQAKTVWSALGWIWGVVGFLTSWGFLRLCRAGYKFSVWSMRRPTLWCWDHTIGATHRAYTRSVIRRQMRRDQEEQRKRLELVSLVRDAVINSIDQATAPKRQSRCTATEKGQRCVLESKHQGCHQTVVETEGGEDVAHAARS